MDYYKEFIGYRTNAKKPLERKEGQVVVYAERRNNMAVLGEYGGDAYPAVYEREKDGLRYGMIIAADGVGKGSFKHPSLNDFLDRKKDRLKGLYEEYENETQLYEFLLAIYGEKIFDPANQDVLDYALKSFSKIPSDGFFAADEKIWNADKPDAQNAQTNTPFYNRDSQSLGSRITTVGLYLKFRNYVSDNNITTWNSASVTALRKEIENYLQKELKSNVKNVFNYNDGKSTDARERYFLCSTVAMWFYIADENKVSAVALNCGDARCYLCDLKDGVRQISVDDAFEDGTMTAFVHYGEKPAVNDAYHDGKFRARIVQADFPCALLCCSDGVYDTCPPVYDGGDDSTTGDKIFLPYGESADANDFAFEINLLAALRRCYGYEDFVREIVFNFYGQSSVPCGEATVGGKGTSAYSAIKSDDSGTLGARFFGETNGCELFKKLREAETTSLDLLQKTIKQSANGKEIPYYDPHVDSSNDKNTKEKEEYACGELKKAIGLILKGAYSEAFDEMKEDDKTTLWGVEGCNEKLAGFGLNAYFFNVPIVWENILENIIADYKQNGLEKSDGKKYEHVLAVDGVADALMDIDFETRVKNFCNVAGNDDDKKLELYKKFQECFFGYSETPKYDTIIEANENNREAWKDESSDQPENINACEVNGEELKDESSASSEENIGNACEPNRVEQKNESPAQTNENPTDSGTDE